MESIERSRWQDRPGLRTLLKVAASLFDAATPAAPGHYSPRCPTGHDAPPTIADANARVSTTLLSAGLPLHRLER